ncbi:hypothetical protein AB0E96_11290, partial [Kitasatospora sp. NPDC036755]|uniref:hypothetical protein n=1 Tax=Kitasatospora sp. NPDC036755 TaxID=3154600 RepID=UPI0033D7B005
MLLRPVVRAGAVRVLAVPAGPDRVAVPSGPDLARRSGALGRGPAGLAADLRSPGLATAELTRGGARLSGLGRHPSGGRTTPGTYLHAVDLVAGRGGLLHHTPGLAPTRRQK